MKVRILGCGTSSGVPRIGGDWGACDPAEPRNRRLRAAILIDTATTRLLVDTGPDMREQLLAAGTDRLDAVIWTHDHADHTHGIDDLRQVFHQRGSPVPGYARAPDLAALKARFGYAFAGRDGYPATIAAEMLTERQTIGDVAVGAVNQPHGAITSAGLRFDHGGRSIGYSTDVSRLTPEMEALFVGLDIWIVDALRRAPHPSHAHLDETLGWIERLRPARAVLTHMDQSMDYRRLCAALPDGVEPGYDGMIL